MKRIAIISPSGKFYGSEQVLFDFLCTTQHKYVIYVPEGTFYDKIKNPGVHTPHLFTSVKKLYLHLAWMLLCGEFDGIYINEGGHIKYLNLLASLFPNKNFYVHIRLLEDCSAARLRKMHKNVSYISISDYITKEVKQNTGIQCYTMYDIYKPSSGIAGIKEFRIENDIVRLGIVGRLTTTKGLYDISHFCNYCENNQTKVHLEFHFFGGIDNHISEVKDFVVKAGTYKNINCKFHGFVNDKKQIYQSIDVLLHFNKVEPLGRIVMEALDFGIPFFGFNTGGIGELAQQFGITDYMIPYETGWEVSFCQQINRLVEQPNRFVNDYQKAKERMKVVCSPQIYTRKLEKIFYE